MLSLLFAAAVATATPPPGCGTPANRQLDFWVGDWELTYDAGGGQTGHATNHITRDEYGDCVIAQRATIASVNRCSR